MANAEELVTDYEARVQKMVWKVNDKEKTVGTDDKILPNTLYHYHDPNTPCVTDIITVPSSQCTAIAHSEELDGLIEGEVDGISADNEYSDAEDEVNLQNLERIHENWNTEDKDDDDDVPSFYSISHHSSSNEDEWDSNSSFGTNES
ncbi:uncharacterized protein EV420DRAFT_1649923 [Desarmillaria tabescens]|uniref:Uncharacterized protein n=1 Tax=Armillaria tabescens TaxID=1929756 RepID=A0AA39JFB0_ARMTA|nr:uncharacterized protein EV420DRAFT_1649923 [Desarmillaria tabescens]KAK0441711.1 hypothetical protein EV420DRAFT_1649923 [Desarmillaria tabescens]